MIPIVAIEIDNNQIMLGVIAAIAILLGLYARIRTWEKSIRGEAMKVEIQSPLHTAEAPRFASHESHISLVVRVDHLERQIQSNHREVLQAGEDRAEGLRSEIRDVHTRVNEVLSAVGEVRGELKRVGSK